jgi:hypothetical protein
MSHLDGLWRVWWLCAGSSTYSPSQLGDHQFRSLRIPTAIGASLCIAVVCGCLLRIPTVIGMWLINLFPLSVCGLDSSVALTLCFTAASASASTQHVSSHAMLAAASSATTSVTLVMHPHQWVSSSSISEIRGDASGICFCSSTWRCTSDSDALTNSKKKKKSTKTHLPHLSLRIHPHDPLIRCLDTPRRSHFQKG